MNHCRCIVSLLIVVVFQVAFSQNGPDTTVSAAQSKLYPIDQIPIADSVKIAEIDFKNTDIRDILRGLGMQYGLNIYLDTTVTGPISLYLTNITVKAAIDFIVKRSNNAYSVENGIVKIYKPQAPPPPAPVRPKTIFHLKDGLLEIDMAELPVQDAVRMFADSAAMNVVADKSIDKTITARLVAIKPDKALKALCESNGLTVAFTDGIYYVQKQVWSESGTAEGTTTSSSRKLSIDVKNLKVSLEIDNASLDQVIRTIAAQGGINIVMYDNLTGEISAKFANVPIEDALRFLLQNTKFTFWKENEIYFIGSREMNQQKTTFIIPLKHIIADESQISKMLPPSISSNAVVKYNSEHNAVILIGAFDVVAQAQDFFRKIDKPIPQVLIEALVVDFNINKIREYGISLFTQGQKDSTGSKYSERFLPDVNLKPGRQKTARILNELLSQVGIDRIIQLPENFAASIHALESADVVRVHSTPQIATINGSAASITIGETRYYKLVKETKAPIENQATVIGTDERFEVIKFNTQLEVTPWIMDEGSVMVKIRPEFNIPRTGGDGTTPPNVDTRIIESMVRLKNGQTIVLGGQRQMENMVSSNGIPLLSSIPILGWLFSSRSVSKVETQMMIFLTPHVYYGDDNAVKPDDYFGKEINRMIDKYDFSKKKEKQSDTLSDTIAMKTVASKKVKTGTKRTPWVRTIWPFNRIHTGCR